MNPLIDITGVAAIAFTSGNGVEAFAVLPQLDALRALPAYAVGEATAETARRLGFEDVRAGGGDVVALADLIAAASPAGVVLAPGAAEPAGDLGGLLRDRGVAARWVTVYETVAAPGMVDLREVDALLVHSPKAGRILAERLAGTAGLGEVSVFAISPAALAPLAGLDFRQSAAAPFPNEASLLKLVSP